MKKLLLVLAVISMLAISKAYAIPNLEASVIYDFESHALVTGMTSKLLGYKDIDFRVGYTETDKWIAGLSFDLKNLAKYGIGVKYFWGDWNLTIGAGLGYSMSTGNLSFNLSSVLIQMNF